VRAEVAVIDSGRTVSVVDGIISVVSIGIPGPAGPAGPAVTDVDSIDKGFLTPEFGGSNTLGGATTRQIQSIRTATDYYYSLAWHPNGRYFYTGTEPLGGETGTGAISCYAVSKRGMISRKSFVAVAGILGIQSIVITRDGKFLFAYDWNNSQIRRYSIATGGALTLIGLTAPSPTPTILQGYQRSMVLDDNSKTLRLATDTGLYSWAVDSAGGLAALPTMAGAFRSVCSDVDSQRVWALSTADTKIYSYLIATDGSLTAEYNVTLPQTGSGSLGGLFASPNGANLIALIGSSSRPIQYSVSADGTLSLVRRLEISDGYFSWVSFSRNSDLFWMSDPGYGFCIACSMLAEEPFRIETSLTIAGYSRTLAVSPDGQTLIVNGATSGVPHIYVCRINQARTGNLAKLSERITVGPVITNGVPSSLSDQAIGGNSWQCITHPTQPWLYVTGATTGLVSQYSYVAGTGVITSLGAALVTTNCKGGAVSPDGKWLYVADRAASGNGTIRQYSINQSTGVLTEIGTPIPAGVPCHQVTIHPSGKWLYSCGQTDNLIYQYAIDQETGLLTALPTPTIAATNAGPFTMACTPDGSTIYVSCIATLNYVYQYAVDQTTGQLSSSYMYQFVPIAGAAGQETDIQVHPSGKWLLSCGQGTVRYVSVWRLSTGESLYRAGNPIPHSRLGLNSFPDQVTSIAIHPNGVDVYLVAVPASVIHCKFDSEGNLSVIGRMNFPVTGYPASSGGGRLAFNPLGTVAFSASQNFTSIARLSIAQGTQSSVQALTTHKTHTSQQSSSFDTISYDWEFAGIRGARLRANTDGGGNSFGPVYFELSNGGGMIARNQVADIPAAPAANYVGFGCAPTSGQSLATNCNSRACYSGGMPHPTINTYGASFRPCGTADPTNAGASFNDIGVCPATTVNGAVKDSTWYLRYNGSVYAYFATADSISSLYKNANGAPGFYLNQPLNCLNIYPAHASSALNFRGADNVIKATLANAGFNILVGSWSASAIGATYGGTGQTVYAVGDLLYANTTTNLTKLAGNTTTNKRYLSQAGNGTTAGAPGWADISAADITLGQLAPIRGGTGIATNASTGVPSIAAGVWSVLTRLTAALGGTGIDTSASTGVPSIAAGVWSVLTRLTAALGGTGIDTSASTGVPRVAAGVWSVGNLVAPTAPPATSTSAGVAGTITWDANWLYVCIATNSWKRIALTSF